VTLLATEMPPHNHPTTLYAQPDTTKREAAPKAGYGLVTPSNPTAFVTTTTPNAAFSPNTIAMAGNNQAHPNQQPYLVLNFCICLQGVFPSFS
ncbi:MAG: microcystin-dependent protein, partial [Rhodanobacter sp.]